MGFWEDYGPLMAMLALQFTYAGVALSIEAALDHGLSTRVFIVYRQAIATLIIAPIAYTNGRGNRAAIGLKTFSMMFIASLFGVTAFQNLYFEGIHLASSSVATAMSNLVPALTFVVTAFLGWEEVDIRSIRTIAKIIGTILCVSGAMAMSFLKGPRLLNSKFPAEESIILFGSKNWLAGCLLLICCCCCWTFWMIFQVPMSKQYPDHLSLSAWMCFLGTLQSGALALFLEPNPETWILHSKTEFFGVFYTGTVGSALSYFVLSWCISKRGPLFVSTFSPMCTVIVAFFACVFFHDELYTGSLIGAVAVVAGLYAVLWGKAKDLANTKKDGKLTIESSESYKIDFQESLLEKNP